MKLRMTLTLALCAAALFVVTLRFRDPVSSAESLDWVQEAAPQTEGERKAVVVELFTSEGCSSCPPADALLAQLEEKQPIAGAEIIALSEHVDYWNRLGWTDPYSSSLFSQRQSDYSRAFGLDDIYTPQMVVDGRAEFVGSLGRRAREVLLEAVNSPKARVTIARSAKTQANEIAVTINVDKLPEGKAGGTAEVYLALTEGKLSSNVSRGENSGRKLAHTAVVRNLKRIGSIDPAKPIFNASENVALEKGWKRENMRLVALVQERASRHILGAAAIKLD
jgi:hypothetical protein